MTAGFRSPRAGYRPAEVRVFVATAGNFGQHTSASLEAGSLPSRVRTLNMVPELPGAVLKVIPANRFARAKSSQRQELQ
jgi:hypothetical protein